jgi:hypothetical protein
MWLKRLDNKNVGKSSIWTKLSMVQVINIASNGYKTYLAWWFTAFENETTLVKKLLCQVTKLIPLVVHVEQVNAKPFTQISQNNMNSVCSIFRSVVVQNLGSLETNIISIKLNGRHHLVTSSNAVSPFSTSILMRPPYAQSQTLVKAFLRLSSETSQGCSSLSKRKRRLGITVLCHMDLASAGRSSIRVVLRLAFPFPFLPFIIA